MPIAPTDLAAFDTAIKTKSQPLGFSVLLLDSAGFKLCTIRIYDADLQLDIDEAGKTQSLSANSSAKFMDFCSLSEYNQASKWNVSWEYFPPVVIAYSAGLIPQGARVGQPRSDKPPAGYHEVQPPWRDKSHWRMLKKGMSKDDVRKLLAEPLKIKSGGTLEYWYYSGAGISGPHVTFDENGKLWGWAEP